MAGLNAPPEAPVWLEINGRRRSLWTCTPVDLETLVVGMLCGSGYIAAAGDVHSLEIVEEPAGCFGVRVRVPEVNAARIALEQRRIREHGCGALHHVLCEPEALRAPRSVSAPAAEALRPAFRALFAATDEAYPEGGMHAAALWVEPNVIEPVFDVGRHNAIDRAIGVAVRRGLERGSAGILLSARVSGAMALRAARAGMGFVASRSLPTSLALQVAAAAELPIVARAGRAGSRESEA